MKLILIGLGVIFLFLAATGRAHALFAILGAGMTQIMRLTPLLIRFAPWIKQYIGGTGPAGASQLSTATVLMTLNQITGAMQGQVIAGTFTGRSMESLSTAELQALCDYCAQHDSDALRLVQAYLQRERQANWNGSSNYGSGNSRQAASTGNQMSTTEAKQVLGIDANTDMNRDTIVSAHRSLMGRFHPDKGGNDYLATKLNTARDVLLKNV